MATLYRNIFRNVKAENRPIAEFLPMPTMLAMKEWDEQDFERRVRARVRQLHELTGKAESRLLKAAGYSGDEIRKAPKRGRRTDTLVKIARSLDWTLGQALGIQNPALFLDREREIDPTKLARALDYAEKTIGSSPEGDRLESVANIASYAYSVLSEREAAGKPLNDEEARELLQSALKLFFPNRLNSQQ